MATLGAGPVTGGFDDGVGVDVGGVVVFAPAFGAAVGLLALLPVLAATAGAGGGVAADSMVLMIERGMVMEEPSASFATRPHRGVRR